MKQTIYRVFALTLILMLTSCSSQGRAIINGVGEVLNDNSLLAGVAAYTATNEIIERSDDPQGRASRILAYTDAVIELVSDEQPVSLDGVYAAVHGLIDWQRIPPVDRPLIEDLLSAVRDRLAREIEQSIALSPETEVSLLHVVKRIRMAAEFHAHG
jgi:hypothetical protein